MLIMKDFVQHLRIKSNTIKTRHSGDMSPLPNVKRP